jgi:protein phosphatase
MKLVVSAATDRGLKRARNEDSHGIWSADDPRVRAARGVLLVVADGMGGARAGDVASRLAVATTLQAYQDAPGTNVLADLRAAVVAANAVLFAENVRAGEPIGMATTLTAAIIRGADVFLAHVGDTRVYALRGRHLTQVTEDHSLVAHLVAEGELTLEEARVDPRRNLLTRSVGLTPDVDVDAGRINWTFAPGDVLVLSTDGLHGLVRNEEMERVITDAGELDAACAELVALAIAAGGVDNITVILARAEENGA